MAGASMGNDGVGHHDASPRAEQRRLSDGVGLFSFPVANPVPSPDFDVDSLNEWDVSHQLASLARRPLLLWHGDADDVVPPEETFRLEQALRQADLAAGLTCVWQKGSAIALRQRRWLPRSPFSAVPLNADYADALILKLFEDRGIGLFAGDHHVYLSGPAE